jgi:hypothetical protein
MKGPCPTLLLAPLFKATVAGPDNSYWYTVASRMKFWKSTVAIIS